MKPWVKDLISYVIIFLAVVIIRTFVATPVRVTGVSMYPTLSGTEIMILNKLGKIERMKVVVIDRGSDDKIIKRVIGLPNEEVAIINNIIYINDKPLTDKYGQGDMEDMQKIKLAYDEYFVLGDNRDESLDSRIIGPIKVGKIMGTTKLVIYPARKIGNIK